ncbi:hypothetical protein, partial [Streptomyces galilaeus]|uniref:hypothetical protein n=1 Tax=Streptomyces galilaeus TaxID=33899 RepID=UPI0038F70B7D
CGSYLRIIHNRDPYAICDENPNLEIEILQTGDWIARGMTNSYFFGDDPAKNNFEVWDTLIRFDRLNDALVEVVPSKSLATARAAA